MNLAFYPTGHGYGHLTRLLAVVSEVQRQQPDVSIHIRAPHPESMVLETLSRAPDTYAQVRLDIGLVARDSLRHNLKASVERLRYYYGPEGNRLVEQEARWLEKTKIDAALLDIPPRALDACALAGVPTFGLTNFSWDDIWRSLKDEEPELGLFADRAAASYTACKRLFRIPMHIGMHVFPVVEDVPLVARHSKIDKEEIRSRLELADEERPLVLIAFGGEGLLDTAMPDATLRTRYHFIVTPPIDNPGEGFFYLDDHQMEQLGLTYTDLVHGVDVVMSKPGYSTVAETAANHTGLILTDRNDFIEAKAIHDYAEAEIPTVRLSLDNLFAGRWGDALDVLLAKRPFDFSNLRSDGAEVVARRLLKEVENS